MTDTLAIETSGPLDGSIRPPGSKSITNRALICAAAAEGPSRLTGALASDDTRVIVEALRSIGIDVHAFDGGSTLEVDGCGGYVPMSDGELFVGNSGTTVRFLTALLAAIGRGRYRLHGTPRMHERPIADLLTTLTELGGNVGSESSTGCPPVVVERSRLRGGAASVRGDVSSQFLSGLLMALPYAVHPTTLHVAGPLVSQPYVRMTLAVMRAFGIEATAADDLSQFEIPHGRYCGIDYGIEPDASAASYFFAAAAITGGRVKVEDLSRGSLQGDVAFVDVLEQMGCTVIDDPHSIAVTAGKLRGITVDMNAISDTVQTLAAVALFADGPTEITGVAHIRHKETDRIAALATELRKLGATVDERTDGLRITPGALHGATIDTYDDHRMAMSLALAGLRVPGVVIRDPGCTAKTYPGFFADLARLRR
ncbi:MAG TPA: 3-phosphoshikimate 1-carboxyvinyltransferase [Pirellulales bacterium]|nr:3-phosphoshikimate 1-carboxyvinyltransferase [Pirellulales bacterium]